MHYRQDSDGPVLSQERGSSVLSHSVQENWEKAVSRSPRGCCGFPWALPTRGEWSLVKREGGVPLETSFFFFFKFFFPGARPGTADVTGPAPDHPHPFRNFFGVPMHNAPYPRFPRPGTAGSP